MEFQHKLKRFCSVLIFAVSLMLLSIGSLFYLNDVTLAQGGEVKLSKTLNKSSNVVRVGEVLSFTVILTNEAAFTLTHVTLVDEYANNVLGFAGADPAHDILDVNNGLVTWSNVATPPIPPGQSLTFTVFFTAEHPQTSVVNAVYARDVTGTLGAIASVTDTDNVSETIGGKAPVYKALSFPDNIPQAGDLVTFTHIVTNDGAAFMTHLPLTDTYDSLFLQLKTAIPTPTLITPPGVLVWTDLTDQFGDLAPFSTVVVTTVFTATTQVITTVNRASTEGARDQYNNDLAAGSALVPITIIEPLPTPSPTSLPTHTPAPESGDDDDDDEVVFQPTPIPTATPFKTPTVMAEQSSLDIEATATPFGPRFLPETGNRENSSSPFALGGWIAILILSGLVSRFILVRSLSDNN